MPISIALSKNVKPISALFAPGFRIKKEYLGKDVQRLEAQAYRNA
jgi:hypothetical protein